MEYRKDMDVLGAVKVPRDAYYGPETQRSIDNFRVSGLKVPLNLVYSYVMLKKAAAIANMKDGKLDGRRGRAIVKACDYILDHKLDAEFPLDVYQSGAGTSLNMNVNEVIANKAIEILHGRKGDYKVVNPNDHVNMSQSTNDTMPSVVHIATYLEVSHSLIPALEGLESAFKKKSEELRGVVKMGRTHMQDAVPMTFGQEFSGYRWAIKNSVSMLKEANRRLLSIPLGGTAVGTGLNSDERYARFALRELNRITGVKFKIAENRYAETQQRIEELAIADALKEVATAINKIANDLRLLTSGPVGGMSDIILPEVLPGSSIMPGKINPSIAEMMNMVCLTVIGNCTVVTDAANGGQLEINAFTPIIIYELLFSIRILTNGSMLFAERCVKGIKVNRENVARHMEMDMSLATALTPYIGYAKSAQIARKAYKEHKSVKQVCIELGVLDRKKLDRILDPKNQAGS